MPNALRTQLLSDLDDVVVECLDRHVVDGRVRLALASTTDLPGPLLVRVRDPNGRALVERLVRSLPATTGSGDSISVPVASAGDYHIELRQVGGRAHVGPLMDPWELDASPRSRPVGAADQGMTAILRAA